MPHLVKCFEHFFAYDRSFTKTVRDPKVFGKVAVLMGGTSAEREVSLKSGQAILKALRTRGVDAWPIDAVDDFLLQLVQQKFDRVFIALHGGLGENGGVQGALECLGIPYIGSTATASALAMDKARSKLVMGSLNLPTPRFGIAYHLSQAKALAEDIGLPVAVKPIAEGSTIGSSCVSNIDDLPKAFQEARQYGPVIVERWIKGRDIFVTVLMGEALPSIEVRLTSGFYDYHAKYKSNNNQYLCPAPLSPEQEEKVRDLAKKSFYALGCSGWGRVDFMLDNKGKFWILEVNTVPGMTETSLVPKSAKAAGLIFEDLVLIILATSLKMNDQKDDRNQAIVQTVSKS